MSLFWLWLGSLEPLSAWIDRFPHQINQIDYACLISSLCKLYQIDSQCLIWSFMLGENRSESRLWNFSATAIHTEMQVTWKQVPVSYLCKDHVSQIPPGRRLKQQHVRAKQLQIWNEAREFECKSNVATSMPCPEDQMASNRLAVEEKHYSLAIAAAARCLGSGVGHGEP